MLWHNVSQHCVKASPDYSTASALFFSPPNRLCYPYGTPPQSVNMPAGCFHNNNVGADRPAPTAHARVLVADTSGSRDAPKEVSD